jgi:flagellar biosynthetic protein FliO
MVRFMRVDRVGAILMLAFLLYLAFSARCSDQTQDTEIKTQDARLKTQDLRQENGSPNLESQMRSGRTSELDDGVSDGGMLDAGIRMAVSLLMVLALIAAGVFVLKKVSPYRGLAASSGNPVSVISKIPLGQKKSICLVRVADEILVIGLTSANVSLLAKMNAEDYYRGDGQTTSQNVKQKDKGSFRRLYSTLIHRKEESIAKDKVSANINTINS